tara:strand:+ start:295 stop:507 length:213 start_codon:yes stop_codon:yes gene_type:complete
VFLNLPSTPAFQRNTVNGLVQILHYVPNGCFNIRTYGLSPRHVSHKIGKSAFSQPYFVTPVLIARPLSPI